MTALEGCSVTGKSSTGNLWLYQPESRTDMLRIGNDVPGRAAFRSAAS